MGWAGPGVSKESNYDVRISVGGGGDEVVKIAIVCGLRGFGDELEDNASISFFLNGIKKRRRKVTSD